MYYQVVDTPKPIVFQFKRACEKANLEELESFFPKEKHGILWFIKNKDTVAQNIIDKEEYVYAFWYGLYGAFKGNNQEALDFILNKKTLKNFIKSSKIKKVLIEYRDLIGIPREKYPSMYDEADYIVPQTPIRHQIDITKPFKIAAEKGNFEIFLRLKDTEIGNHINWESILMCAFKNMNKDIFEKFKKIENIKQIVDKYLELACEYIIENKNEYAIGVLRDYFKVKLKNDSHLLIENYQKDQEFANYLKLNLIINEGSNIRASQKIKI